MANDLNEPNNILFDALRDVREGKCDEKRANATIGTGNALVGNARVQPRAMKLSGSKRATGLMGPPGAEGPGEAPTGGRHGACTEAAQTQGRRTVADAIAKLGKRAFDRMVDEYLAESENQKNDRHEKF